MTGPNSLDSNRMDLAANSEGSDVTADVNIDQRCEDRYNEFGNLGIKNEFKSFASISTNGILENDFHSQTKIDLNQLRLCDYNTSHKLGLPVPKNRTGIQEPDNNLSKRGQWFACHRTSPMLRRYSASGSEGQNSLCRSRTISSTSVTPRKNKITESFSGKDNIASFQRSLKLLGLQPKDFGINTEANRPSSHTATSRVEPTFCTRLKKRSFSVESLKNALQDSIADNDGASGDHLDRRTLSSAIYEEWYFRKLEEARKKKEAEEIREREKQEYFQKIKMEQKQKSKENFMKWKELKKKQKHKDKQEKKVDSGATKDDRLMNGTTKIKQNQEEAFLLWKREKDKQLKKKKMENVTNKATKQDEEKKASAQSAFMAWKKQTDEALKEEAKQKEKKRQEEEEEKRRKEQEKRENAESSYRAWKRRKDAELRKKIREDKLAEEQKNNEKLMQEFERSYEVERAFEEWLDQAEERRYRQMRAVLNEKKKNQYRLPWSPGGSIT